MNRRKKIYVLVGMSLAALLIAGIVAYHSYSSLPTGQVQDSPDPQNPGAIAAHFRILSQAHTDVCAYLGDQQANTNYIDSLPANYYLQGSCCTPMVYSHYLSQIGGLKNYSGISIMPQDPYNVSSSSAKLMISYDGAALTPSQQATYDSAVKTSGEGPCCCQCWAWYAHEGLAKALISQHGWNAQQIANIWDLEDCCGG